MFQVSIGELISVEQDGDDYIRPNADLEMKPQIRSREQLKCMYSEWLDGRGKFKDLEYHIELDPNKPRVQTPQKVVVCGVWTKEKSKIRLENKA